MKSVLVALGIGIASYLVTEVIRVRRLMRRSAILIRTARPFTKTDGRLSMLVLGDSTAVGVGADRPEESVAGRFGKQLDAAVENYGRSGAVVADLMTQISHAQGARYDLIIILCGGNDIIKLLPLRTSTEAMDNALRIAGEKSEHVVLLTAGRLGHAPFFPRTIAWLFTRRSLTVRARFSELATKHNALYVDLLGMSPTLNADPRRFYADDMLHLSGSGYGVWFEKIVAELKTRWPRLCTEERQV